MKTKTKAKIICALIMVLAICNFGLATYAGPGNGGGGPPPILSPPPIVDPFITAADIELEME